MVSLIWKCIQPNVDWVIIFTIFVFSSGLLSLPLVIARRCKAVEALHLIDFDYLPISPLERGWTHAYLPDGAADFNVDTTITGSLRVGVTNSVFAMDHMIPLHATLSNRLEFIAKYTDSTMIFTGVDVASKDGSQRRRVWIKYYYGEKRADQTWPTVQSNPDKYLPEQTVWLPARVLEGGKLAFEIDFPDVVKLAIGDQGWVYKSIWKVRLRGSLSISPLKLGSVTPPS